MDIKTIWLEFRLDTKYLISKEYNDSEKILSKKNDLLAKKTELNKPIDDIIEELEKMIDKLVSSPFNKIDYSIENNTNFIKSFIVEKLSKIYYAGANSNKSLIVNREELQIIYNYLSFGGLAYYVSVTEK